MYDDCPRMIPSIKNGTATEDINFFSQLERNSTDAFTPLGFNDTAFVIYDTNGAAALADILAKKRLVDAWKKSNPSMILLDAKKEVKKSPRKTRPSNIATMEATGTSITHLPGEEEPGDELGDIEDEEEIEIKEMVAEIREIDWSTVNFEVPSTKIDQKKGAPPKLEQYRNLLKLCKIRDLSLWLNDQEVEHLQKYSDPQHNLPDLREKLKEWKLFTYKTKAAENGVKREEAKLIDVQPNDQAVKHPTTTTAVETRANAKRVQPISIAEMVNEMGDNRELFLNKLKENLNHVLHHVSSISRKLDSQSNSLMTANPPGAITLFSDAEVGFWGLRRNIERFAIEFGLPKKSLIQEPPIEPKVDKWKIDSAQFGQKMSAENLAEIIENTTKDGIATNFRMYDIRMLVDSMGWQQELTSVLDPNELVYRALMFGCDDISELAVDYHDSANKKKSTNNIGRLAGYLHELSQNGWAVSLDKRDQNQYLSLVTKDLDNYLSSWKPIQYEEDTPQKGQAGKSNIRQ